MYVATPDNTGRCSLSRNRKGPALGALSVAVWLALPPLGLGAETDPALEAYNTSFLQGAQAGLDLNLLLAADSVLPGHYRVDVYSNRVLVGRRDLDFVRSPHSGRVEACLTYALLEQLGIDLRKLQAQGTLEPGERQACLHLPSLIEQASVRYDPSRLRLAVSIPQIWMEKGRRGYVDPALWDAGVSAAFVNYQLSSNRNAAQAGVRLSNNLGLRNGINLGGWRLRNESNLSTGSGRPSRFTSNRSYLQHDVSAIKGQFSAGEIFSDGTLFDSVRYRGLKLASDESMRADSERGYAPVVRGVAQSNATVQIRQNDYILSTSNVPPGPFEIGDIYPSGSNGDLEITVVEADGSRHVSRQAFSALPIMVRESQLNYNLSLGHYRSNDRADARPALLSGSAAYGLSSDLTAILGAQVSDGYRALALGMGKNTWLGAVSLDLTHSSSQAAGSSTQGDSVRALYAKTFTGTDTSFTLAAYRYSTEGFRTLSEHVQHDAFDRSGNSKTRTDLTVNQLMGRDQQYGSLYLTASDQRYWNRGGSRSFSVGYSNSWGELNYNLGLSHTQSLDSTGASNDNQLSLALSFPLGSRPRAPRAFVGSSSQRSGSSVQAGVNGYLSDTGDVAYSLQAGSASGGSTGSANLSTRTSLGDFAASYSQGRGYRAQSLSAAGSVVAHGGGINLGQTVGETFALVEVPGVVGAKVASYSGVSTGRNGYAVVPNVQPYRVNWISLDTRDLGAEVELESATQQRVPRRGAVVKARYVGSSGRRVQFELFDAQQQPLPFGAVIEDSRGKQLSLSDPSGRALTLLEEDQGLLTIRWAAAQCQVPYSLPEKTAGRYYERVRLACLN